MFTSSEPTCLEQARPELRSPKAVVLDRWRQTQRTLRFDFAREQYVQTVPTGCPTAGYRQDREPTVDAAPYRIGPARLTVNAYNALVLNSPTMLIADIDAGDPRLNQFATVRDEREVLGNLAALGLFDAANNTDLRSASWRVYRTYAGFRVICTSHLFPEAWLGERVLRFLRADPRYIALCREQNNYRARLTPKPWRYEEAEWNGVCDLIEQIGDHVTPTLAEQLKLHDDLTLAN